MRNIYIKQCVRKDGTVDIVKIEGGNTRVSQRKVRQNKSIDGNNLECENSIENVETPKIIVANNRLIDPETGVVMRDSKLLYRIMKKGREKVYYNIVNRKKTCLLYRLGYEPRNKDIERTSTDFERFIRKIRKEYKSKFGNIYYFNVIDFHEDMSLHIHGILYAPDTKKRIRIDQARFTEIWGQGNVWLENARKNTHFDYILPLPTKSTSDKARKINAKFTRYLWLPAFIKIPRSSGFDNPQYNEISLTEYEELKAARKPDISRNFSYDYTGNKVENEYTNGYGIVTYTYETYFNNEVQNEEKKK